ncbi:MAG: hypothetical protein P4M12_01490 [Gammaproteobacteria bacterium]|nr:hypothetical protein [Gammaproteobacteria bacterium]
MLPYKVTKRYQRGAEQSLARFQEQDDAKLFIQAKLEWDANYKVNASYQLYDFDDLIEEFSQDQSAAGEATSQGQGTQQTSKQVFSPSPLQMAPRPGSVPYSSFKDVKDTKDDDKK